MKDYNEEYYYLTANGINFPALDFDGPNMIRNKYKFFRKNAVDEEIIPLRFSDPIPRKPQMADVHSMASNRVFSERIKKTLEEICLKNVQFIPVVITDKNDELISGYYIPHIYNVIKCADMENSIYEDDNDDDTEEDDIIYEFEKLVLDNTILDKIPLNDRLVFLVGESNLKRLYHRSIAEKILSLKPTGVSFYQLSTYDESKPFQAEFLDWIMNEDD